MNNLNDIYRTISSCLASEDITEIKRLLECLKLNSKKCIFCDNQNGYGEFKGDMCYVCWRMKNA